MGVGGWCGGGRVVVEVGGSYVSQVSQTHISYSVFIWWVTRSYVCGPLCHHQHQLSQFNWASFDT